jgi:hypothetical protein
MPRYNRYRAHATRYHQSGLAIADKIAGAMLMTILVGGMYAMVAYANHRDSKSFCGSVSSVPSRPWEQEREEVPEQPRTIEYLDILPPSA